MCFTVSGLRNEARFLFELRRLPPGLEFDHGNRPVKSRVTWLLVFSRDPIGIEFSKNRLSIPSASG